MKKIITIFISVLLICSVNILPTALVAAVPLKAEGSEAVRVYTIEERLALLRVKFPHGKYWNHLHTGNDKGDPDVATDTPCCSRSSSYQVVGEYCCNTFDGAMQCMGFAYKMFYDLHGVYGSMQTKRYDVENIQVGDYVRLNNLQLGYNLPSKVCKHLGISNLRVYIGGSRLFTITRYDGYDPAVGADVGLMGVDEAIYPLSRTYMAGLNFVF